MNSLVWDKQDIFRDAVESYINKFTCSISRRKKALQWNENPWKEALWRIEKLEKQKKRLSDIFKKEEYAVEDITNILDLCENTAQKLKYIPLALWQYIPEIYLNEIIAYRDYPMSKDGLYQPRLAIAKALRAWQNKKIVDKCESDEESYSRISIKWDHYQYLPNEFQKFIYNKLESLHAKLSPWLGWWQEKYAIICELLKIEPKSFKKQ